MPILFVGAEELKNEGISVYPNPATETLNIDLNSLNGNEHILLQNLAGQTLMNVRVLSQHTELNVSELPTGIYILEIEKGTERFQQRVMLN